MLEEGDVLKIIEGTQQVTVELIAIAKVMPYGVRRWKVLSMGIQSYVYEWPFDPSIGPSSSQDWLLKPMGAPRVSAGQLLYEGQVQKEGLPSRQSFKAELKEQTIGEEDWNKFFLL